MIHGLGVAVLSHVEEYSPRLVRAPFMDQGDTVLDDALRLRGAGGRQGEEKRKDKAQPNTTLRVRRIQSR